ncbi:hypothetical protein DVH05_012614 [Phytophthora capsici]|nr:hypothetical protein DVH05_012611 [Phytophthora capsici]KAG1699722.1 hypothetical protein DVH05_012614 [Phytophthora capsici]
MKVNEAIKYKGRYDSSFKTKLNKWLQTFAEYVEAGHFDDDSDSEEASQPAEFDADSVREDRNVDMANVAESEDLDGSMGQDGAGQRAS